MQELQAVGATQISSSRATVYVSGLSADHLVHTDIEAMDANMASKPTDSTHLVVRPQSRMLLQNLPRMTLGAQDRSFTRSLRIVVQFDSTFNDGTHAPGIACYYHSMGPYKLRNWECKDVIISSAQ